MYVEIPFQTVFDVVPQRYTFGIFVRQATKNENDVDAAFELALREIFREEIEKALGTFF
jgi:hypothetical protein